MGVKFICMSDTHSRHEQMTVPSGDVILHAGDFSMMGRVAEVQPFLDWLSALPHKYKVLICGNHDWLGEKDPGLMEQMCKDRGIIYLNDSGATVEGFKIWGSPVQPWFCNWAFNRVRGEEINKHWVLIPEDTDILITHGPPHKILDRVWHKWDIATNRPIKSHGYRHTGCEMLAKRIEVVKPQMHVCGHIHCDRGIKIKDGITYVNAAIVDETYMVAHKCIEVNL